MKVIELVAILDRQFSPDAEVRVAIDILGDFAISDVVDGFLMSDGTAYIILTNEVKGS